MIPIYQKTLKIRAEHVDFCRKLRISTLMRLFQECCIAHTEELGMGREKTLDKGFLWVVNSERILIHRLPEYDEEITLVCYPGTTLHYFFPRHMEVKDSRGETIIQIHGIWALIDEKKRSFIDPGKNGIVIKGGETGKEIPPVLALPMPALEKETILTASYSLTDINGHLNNASYIDCCMDLFDPKDLKKGKLEEVCFSFKKEIPFGESIKMSYGKVDKSYCFASPYFLLKATYK